MNKHIKGWWTMYETILCGSNKEPKAHYVFLKSSSSTTKSKWNKQETNLSPKWILEIGGIISHPSCDKPPSIDPM
jgi:hypothetical protein